jgi:4-hydroxybenzoate polyprenyltransferase
MSSTGRHSSGPVPWPRYGSFVAWLAIGAGACLALLTPLTIGLFVLVVVIVGLAVLVRRGGGIDAGVTGLLTGAGMLALYIAYLNRHGPGEICGHSATEHHCRTEWSPWPWLFVGLLLVAAGVVLFRVLARGGDDRDQGVRAAGSSP